MSELSQFPAVAGLKQSHKKWKLSIHLIQYNAHRFLKKEPKTTRTHK